MKGIGFDEFYGGLYGERWSELRLALEREPAALGFERGLAAPYFLDPASVEAAQALNVAPGDRVLDLCAAPGGKSLVLAAAMGREGTLTANDRSSARRARLRRVLDEHLPPELRARVSVTPHDASRWGLHERDAYDRVLVDVPCSSERHLLRSPAHLAKWSPARTRHLAVQAYAILAAGFAAVRPGGSVVYSTCTVSSYENDEVIRKLTVKRGAEVLLDGPELAIGEPTELGWLILPDRCGGLGPIYIARVRKRASAEASHRN